MKASQIIIATLREVPQDAQVLSHRLMIRAGLIRSSGSGLYSFLPMGLRVMRKIEKIIREEMDLSGAQECLLPILTSSDLWKKAGRWEEMGREMFRIKDRHDNWCALGPTHEEAFTELIKGLIFSYKNLPLNVYQIHSKFRDEIRPRFGVIRSREFIMKDAYSFDIDEESLQKTYEKMRYVYRRIFKRMGLDTISVEADSGSMGGSGSEEFMVASEIGEETLMISEGKKYKGNREKTPVIYAKRKKDTWQKTKPSELKKIHTPECKSMQDVAEFLKVQLHETIKAVVFSSNKDIIFIFLQGDREINEVKLANHLIDSFTDKMQMLDLQAAEENSIIEAGSVPGFIGPFDLDVNAIILFDESIQPGKKYVVGANQKDYHLQDHVFSDQLQAVDLALARAGDLSPESDGNLEEVKGIEVGHIFKLGKKYTEAFDLQVLDSNGKPVTPTMGCYGIGVNRSMATIIEQNNDDLGIVWPISIAPFEVVLIAIAKGDEQIKQIDGLYKKLKDAGIDILYDDRSIRPGVKFKDAELIGFPIRITAGKDYFENGNIELQLRQEGVGVEKRKVSEDKIIDIVISQVKKLYEGFEYL